MSSVRSLSKTSSPSSSIVYNNLNNPNQVFAPNTYSLLHLLRANLLKVITVLIALLLCFEYASYYYVYTSNGTIYSFEASSRDQLDSYLISSASASQWPLAQAFANYSFYRPNNSELCPIVPPNLVGRLKVMRDDISFTDIEKNLSDLLPGGHYRPDNCTARQRIALIIPYRNREMHLRAFLNNIHPFLKRQQADYTIFVIEQFGQSKFNRAKLFNVGFVEALKLYDFDCFIFHDVDLIPEDDRNLYRCAEQPRHMSVAVDTMHYTLPYKDIFGGVSALTKEQMLKVNGFSNVYWGWGGEDDDMSARIRHYGFKISRYPAKIARYTMLSHKKETPNPERYQKLYRGKFRFKTDGLNNLKYERVDLVLKRLFTLIRVDLLPFKKMKIIQSALT